MEPLMIPDKISLATQFPTYTNVSDEEVPLPTCHSKPKCTKKMKIISIVFILCFTIAIISTIIILLTIKHTNSNVGKQQQPMPMVAKRLDYISYMQSNDIYMCVNSTQCSNQAIKSNNIFCYNSGTCSHSKLVSLSSSGSINCISEKSCFSANLLLANGSNSTINCAANKSCMQIANGLKTSGTLHCDGTKSCYNISSSVQATYIQCSGEKSCAADGIHADIINCSGSWSCSNAFIYAKQVHALSSIYPITKTDIFAENTDNISVYLHDDLSGSFGNIRCKNESICNVYCYTETACVDLNVFVYSNKTVLNLFCDGNISCPDVWYMDGSSTAPNYEFDNTQLFTDNHGFTLNDEMFDVGRDWILEGDFNLNITFQNYGETNDGADNPEPNLNSNVQRLLNATILSMNNSKSSNKNAGAALQNEFDNTQFFKDNFGFVLNDEMFDVGRDWRLGGDFNLNIIFQNAETKDDNSTI